MNWINSKSMGAIAVAALLSGLATHYFKQHEVDDLRVENARLLGEQKRIEHDLDAALAASTENKIEIERLRDELQGIVQLRGEVAQMRMQMDAPRIPIRMRPGSVAAATATPHAPGEYISKEDLQAVGYSTPEAALETISWAMINGTYDQANAGLAPEMLADELKNPKGADDFEEGQATASSLFIGMKIMARKFLSDDRVEIKTAMDYDPADPDAAKSAILLQPMVRVGNEWKLAGSTYPYRRVWDTEGAILTFAQ